MSYQDVQHWYQGDPCECKPLPEPPCRFCTEALLCPTCSNVTKHGDKCAECNASEAEALADAREDR